MNQISPNKLTSYIKLVSGEWIVGCLIGMNEESVTVAFPMEENIWKMWLEETEVQLFQFTHSDYVVIKQANEKIANKWGDFIKRKYPREYQAMAEQLTESAGINKVPEGATIH